MLIGLFVLLYSIIRKEYRYTGAAGLSLIYFLLDNLQSSHIFIDNSHFLSLTQRLTLVTLAGFMLFVLWKTPDKKGHLLTAVCAWIACVSRFLRTILFNLYISNMQEPGADVLAIYTEFDFYCTVVDSVTKLALCVMLFSIAWRLGKPVHE